MEYLCKTHVDERGHRIFNMFPNASKEGQINLQYFFDPSIVTAWHSHSHHETFFCIKGAFKFGIVHEKEFSIDEKKSVCTMNGVKLPQNYYIEWDYLSDKTPHRGITIDSNLWHGFRCLIPGSILLYYISEKYKLENIKREPITKYSTVEEWFNNGSS